MILSSKPSDNTAMPTLWGLDPIGLHDHFWAARGVHVVRRGYLAPIADNAELYLLTETRTLCMFRLRLLIDALTWSKPDVLFVRLRNSRDRGYREEILTEANGLFTGFQRNYGGTDSRLARVALTRHRDIAYIWQNLHDPQSAWRKLRHQIPRSQREVVALSGRVYDRSTTGEVAQMTRDLIQFWQQPASTIRDIQRLSPGVWAYKDAKLDPSVRFLGEVWVGAGRVVPPGTTVLGPAALWDDPAARPSIPGVNWEEIEPSQVLARPIHARPLSSFHLLAKRVFDIVFATVMLLLTLPLYPLVMLAIWLEDGRPFFFGHRRETRGGKEFSCLKFRSMRKDADAIKAQLAKSNQSDGPQFYIEEDPRLTRVGRFIRKCNIDELPQFINVLLGHMSVVGPRPSPRKENQYCPAWREARLSVRPGITGLWQVRRTRQHGLDFQEWIRYDIEYVEKASWWLDLKIIAKTLETIIQGITQS